MVSAGHGEGGFKYHWEPGEYALAYERLGEVAAGIPRVRIVRHPTAPFVADLDDGVEPSDELLQQIGLTYVAALNEKLVSFGYEGGLGLPPGWLDALRDPEPGQFFAWLPIEPPFEDAADERKTYVALASYRLLRRSSAGYGEAGAAEDTTVILVAAETIPDDHTDTERAANSDFGLRVVMDFRSHEGGERVSIAAMTAHLPHSPYTTLAQLDPKQFNIMKLISLSYIDDILQDKDPDIATAFQLLPGLTFETLRFLDPVDPAAGEPELFFEVSGTGADALRRTVGPISYGFTAMIGPLTAQPGGESVRPLAKSALTTNVAPPGRAKVFEQDPSSWRELDDLHAQLEPYDWSARRPTRSEDQLDNFRRFVQIGNSDSVLLETNDFAVLNCPGYVHTDPDNHDTKVVNLPSGVWPPVRANDHSAVSAYWNSDQLFRTMRGFGLDPELYFHATQYGLDVFYRSGISPGPGKDGQTINARVSLKKEGKGFLPIDRPKVEIHLALGNLSHRARWVPTAPTPAGNFRPTWAEPLGIATSERWMWHEFGHVLIAARLGELEFRFAHSVGDALAAVWSDPFSRLADPRDLGSDSLTKRFRGITFPWVFLTRRHDRCVLNGWSWSGTFQRPVMNAPERDRAGRKGYLSEQILSSTLFRLYRILGGDTLDVEDHGPDYATRETASNVVQYLVMRGLETFAQPPENAEELEAALIDADLGLTTPLDLTLHSGATYAWKGGLAHKVIRWAFEAQGMHWPDDQAVYNAPGPPPSVDIYIEDKRPTVEETDGGSVQHGPGGYVPVSLDWAGSPLWQASLSPDFSAIIRNRGDQPATNVSLRAWFGWVSGDPEVRGWDRTAVIHWFPPIGLALASQVVPAGGRVDAESPGPPPEAPSAELGRFMLLVEATCPDDRANSDPAAGLPCAVTSSPPTMPRELADLVANDNNLGLWMLP